MNGPKFLMEQINYSDKLLRNPQERWKNSRLMFKNATLRSNEMFLKKQKKRTNREWLKYGLTSQFFLQLLNSLCVPPFILLQRINKVFQVLERIYFLFHLIETFL